MLTNTIIANFPSNVEKIKETVQLDKGQIWMAELIGRGSVQKSKRPVIILQNDMASLHSPCVTIVPLSSQINKRNLPTHVYISKSTGLYMDSIALCEQIQTIDKSQLMNFTGVQLDKKIVNDITKGVLTQLGVKFH